MTTRSGSVPPHPSGVTTRTCHHHLGSPGSTAGSTAGRVSPTECSDGEHDITVAALTVATFSMARRATAFGGMPGAARVVATPAVLT